MNKIKIAFLLISLFTGTLIKAQNYFSEFENLFTPARHYTVFRTNSKVEIDGKANDADWKNAVWTDDFVDIEGAKMPTPLYRTKVKMLWDEKNLYILAELEEPHVWGYFQEHDVIIFNENDFEVFIDPDGDSQNYFELEINSQNTIFDLFMPRPYRDGGTPLISWNAPGLKTGVSVDGTPNNHTNIDKRWTVEMAIPFNALQLGTGNQKPANNQIWHINFSRVQWQTEVIDGVYKRKTDPHTKQIINENNWVWSPPGIINMHYPERWGLMQFSEMPANGQNNEFKTPTNQTMVQYLWLAYYKQKKYQHENKQYATQLSELQLPHKIATETAGTIQLELAATPNQFLVTLITEQGAKMWINEYGILRK